VIYNKIVHATYFLIKGEENIAYRFFSIWILSDILTLHEREQFCEGYAKLPRQKSKKRFEYGKGISSQIPANISFLVIGLISQKGLMSSLFVSRSLGGVFR
jgi:hypothetical protein